MASRAVQSLLASRHEMARLHRMVVRVGAASAWFVVALYLALGAFTGDESLFIEMLGPVFAAVLMTAQILAGREDGGIALFGSGVVVAIWYSAFGDESTIVPASVALVVIGSLGMLFVSRGRVYAVVGIAVLFGAMPWFWDLEIDQRIVLGTIMSLSFFLAHFILGSIQATTAALNARYQMLFEQSPTAVLEEDWSKSIEYVRSEYTGKAERIKQFLMAYPAVVRRAVGLAKVLRANEAAMILLEIDKPTRFLGYRDPEVVTEENLENFVDALVGLYQGDTTWSQEIPIRTHRGSLRWIQARSIDASTAKPATSIVVALADVTHLRAKSEAMAELVKAKDEFIANVSHELRTPLTAVIGLTSEMASMDYQSEDERAELMRLVADQAAEMSNIVDDLLVAARAEMGTVAIDVQAMDIVAELKSTLDGLGFDVGMPSSAPPLVMADPRRVRQILRNLLTNAHRYGGSRRRVETGSAGDRVWLEVRDNGEAIPREDVDRVFQPYVRGGTRVQGSVGLGLAVARQLAELMHGSLTYHHDGSESIFRLQLPAADRLEPALASQADSV